MSNLALEGSVLPEDDESVFQTHEGLAFSRESPNKVQMSVPNPKRTVPVNFLSLPDEDSYSPFLDEPLEAVPNSVHQVKSSLIKPSTTATPEIFEFSSEAQQQDCNLSARTNGSAASNADQTGSSRGIIGSARKCKSSNSLGPGGEGDVVLGSWPSGLSGPILSRTTSPLGPVGGAIRPASTSPAPSATSRLHLLGSSDRQVQQLNGHESANNGNISSPWDTVQLHQQRQMQHLPICRPSSTPAYPTSITSLFKTDHHSSHFELGFDGSSDLQKRDGLSNSNGLRSSGGSHFGDLLRSCEAPADLAGLSSAAASSAGITAAAAAAAAASDHSTGQQQNSQQGPVRGRDRDYSFGSLLGLNDLTSKLTLRNNTSTVSSDPSAGGARHDGSGRRVAFGDLSSSTSANNNGHGLGSLSLADGLLADRGVSGSFFDFHSGGTSSHGGLTQRESLRAGLALGGTVSAPPQFLTNLYATDGFDFGGPAHSGSGNSAPVTALAARPLNSTTYASVIGGSHQDQSSSASAAPSSRTHSPVPQAGFVSIPQLQQQKQMRQSPVPGQPQPPADNTNTAADLVGANVDSSVEGAVLRSCREILAGAADRSLKAVELANTLRARVGTESLARVREQWGGLLSLLEKHSAHFRVDRIPKNDKVTLVSGDCEDGDDGAAFGDAGFGARSGGLRSNGSGSSKPHGFSSQGGDAGNWSATAGASAAAGATRCLHVGNVPANMSEVQLMREFEKFGQLDGLKLVSQRNGTRRFAFITFHSIEQAITARHCLSKVHPWKSAISFAHKEFTQHSGGSGGVSSSGGPSAAGHLPLHHQQHHHHQQQQQQLQHQIMMMRHAQLSMPTGSPYGAMPDYQQQPQQQLGGNLLYQMQNNHQMMMAQQQQQAGMTMMAPYAYMNAPYGNVLGTQPPQQQQASPYWMHQPQQVPQQQQLHHLPLQPFANPGDSFLPLNSGNAAAPVLHSFTASAQPSQAQAQAFPQQPGVDMDCPVLRRLCDDTYVPTQPWPVDAARDQPYCLAVIAQLQHFDGFTTISKLRGFLRNRVAAVDNIKSVPLKAMLVAYPQYFTLVSNYVHLVNNNPPTAGNGPTSAI